MTEKKRKLFDGPYDLVVIGGGITGAGIIRDASMRGLKTLLVEKGDFSSGTSSRSGKLIHGGLRYLKYFQFKLVYESCKERYYLWKIVAPHIVKRVKFFYPFFKSNKTPSWLILLGVFLYSALANFRSLGMPRLILRNKLYQLIPSLNPSAWGGVAYYDCRANDSRLTIDTLKSAEQAGGEVRNYLEVLRVEVVGGDYLLSLKDHIDNGNIFKIKSHSIINATGAWSDVVLGDRVQGNQKLFNLKMSEGIHLIFSQQKLSLKEVLTLEARADHRNIYCVPWGDYVLIGTTDRIYTGNPDSPQIQSEDVAYLLDTLNFYFPKANISPQDILSATVGIRPLVGSSNGKREEEISRDYEFYFSAPAMLSVTGGKLTTYRLMAKKCLDLMIKKNIFQHNLSPCKTLSPISGADIEDEKAVLNKFERNMFNRYGSNYKYIVKLDGPDGKIPKLEYYWKEIRYIVENEYVERLEDLLVRRTEIFFVAPYLETAILNKLAQYVGNLKKWSDARVQEEVSFYLSAVSSLPSKK